MEFLPVEIVSHILRFLPSLEDRKAASLVCKLWYEVYQSPEFRTNEIVEIVSSEGFHELTRLTNQNRVFFHFRISGVDIDKNSKEFWDRFGPNIRTLSIFNCDLTESTFLNVMIRCDKLESLCIQNCSELLMSGILLKNETDRISLQGKLKHLKTLNLSCNRYLSDAIFVRFTSICDNLQELSLFGCHISFHAGVYRKFYRNGHSEPSENVFMFPVILDFIKKHSDKLKLLCFRYTLIDSNAVSCIAQVENLSLKRLYISDCVQITNDAITAVSDYQLSLTHLDLSNCPRITDVSLLTICSRLNNLKWLSVQGCRAVTDLGISDLWRLTMLHYLNLSECELISDSGITKGLCRRENQNLRELYLRRLVNLTENSIVGLIEYLPNLIVLDLCYCYTAVTDRSVQAICSNAKHIRSLILSMCEGLTDRGLTGIALSPVSPTLKPETQSKHLKIPLGSKEELKIIRDAKLKQDVEQICESIRLTTDVSGSSLVNLKYLQNLNLSGCNHISDVSLKYAFKLDDLRTLDLSHCQQITAEGLACVCENNRAIDSLNLDNCYNVNDDVVVNIFKNLKRLKSLVLGSSQITDRIVDYMCEKNVRLRFLNISHCPQLSTLAIGKLMECYPALNIVHPLTKSTTAPYMIPPPPPFINDRKLLV